MMGMKVAMVVNTPNMTGNDTSCVPRTAASMRPAPACSWLYTRSPTTMASSTSTPMTRMNAMTDSVLIEMPNSGKVDTAPSSATGMPAATQMARRKRRNRVRINNTRSMPLRAFLPSTFIRSTRSCDSSCQIVRSMPSGISRRANSR